MKLLIEIRNAKPSWIALDSDARDKFLSPVGSLMNKLAGEGAEIITWGLNDDATPKRAPYDFFGVFSFLYERAATEYEKVFEAAEWYDYFDQINIMGEMESYASVLRRLSDLEICTSIRDG